MPVAYIFPPPLGGGGHPQRTRRDPSRLPGCPRPYLPHPGRPQCSPGRCCRHGLLTWRRARPPRLPPADVPRGGAGRRYRRLPSRRRLRPGVAGSAAPPPNRRCRRRRHLHPMGRLPRPLPDVHRPPRPGRPRPVWRRQWHARDGAPSPCTDAALLRHHF
ncbi:hypothetical protein BU14_0731s0008 [Porphyra umbilicalis]|uniref:Uncharacterized protein n=1 Tax=Porphyra umbilicalis TaxID=2786 RepID=A0A1X6NQ85_PORUM|nr:hypothetical protein BU14_0731s0008 [Porphyra umbilicalis]|eukprot:OSX70533.1 hypothetical protein BU14_0731s0008 [Porphyra umbilicalis]